MSALVPNRAKRHPMTVVTRARELSGWGYTTAAVVDMLRRDEGVIVSRSTVARWVSPEREVNAWRDNRRRAEAAAGQSGARPMAPPRSRPEYRLARMLSLREKCGLKDAQIARVMAFDFGDQLTNEMVAYALETGRYPRSLR